MTQSAFNPRLRASVKFGIIARILQAVGENQCQDQSHAATGPENPPLPGLHSVLRDMRRKDPTILVAARHRLRQSRSRGFEKFYNCRPFIACKASNDITVNGHRFVIPAELAKRISFARECPGYLLLHLRFSIRAKSGEHV